VTNDGTWKIPVDTAENARSSATTTPPVGKTVSDEDSKFAYGILQSRFVTRQQLDECLDEVARMASEGTIKSLRDVMVDRNVLSSAQAAAIALAIRKKQTSVFGGFQIERKIGEGGMGAVYKARQVALDRTVALKVLPPELVEDSSYVRRFLSEARLAAKLDHPNVVRAIDFGEVEGKYYFAMEYVEGHTLEEEIEEREALPEAEALGRAIQAARGLECAWRGGLVHRDIKPENLLIGPDGELKIADLGLARETGQGGYTTREGERVTMGTPDYIAPEQARGDEVDIRADIYSLGITLYRTLTGRFPFTGEDSNAVIRDRFERMPPAVCEVDEGLSEEFTDVIETMMAFSLNERYPDPAVLLHDLELLAEGKPPAYAGTDDSSRSHALEASRGRQLKTGSFTVVSRPRGQHARLADMPLGREEECAAFYRVVLKLFDEEKYAEAARRIDAEQARFSRTKYAPLLKTLRDASARIANLK
jgi:serine/threonine-protein kinase